MIYKYVPYRLSLGAPALVTGLVHDPNTVPTLHFIPGSMLRGSLARVFGDPGTDGAKQAAFRSLVLGGAVSWLNAYPIMEGERSIPAPTAFQKPKSSEENATIEGHDLSAFDGRPDDSHDVKDHWPDDALAGLSEKFVTLAGNKHFASVRITGRVHQQRDRERGRAWTSTDIATGREERHGTLYAYESLDAGQTFEGEIQIRAATEAGCDDIRQQIETLLGGGLVLVGRSRRAGYGGDAEIKFLPIRPREWPQISGLLTQDLSPGDGFRALLTSACLVRDSETGQFDPGALSAALVATFNQRVKVERLRLSFQSIGGFNRKWRLETPQIPAVSAGSVVLLRSLTRLTLSELQAIEHVGLGERRVEGFGRLVFLIPALQTIRLTSVPTPQAASPPTSAAPELVTEIERRIIEAAVNRQIEETAGHLINGTRRPPSNSLLGRLREPLRNQESDAALVQALATLRTWLGGEDVSRRLREPAMKQLSLS